MLFDNLRKRYNKKKNDVKKSKKSGSATTDAEKAEKALAPYKFLSWLDAFVYTRESKTNLMDEERNESQDNNNENDLSDGDEMKENEVYVEETGDSIDADSGVLYNGDEDADSSTNTEMFTSPEPARKKQKNSLNTSKTTQPRSNKSTKATYLDEMELSVIKSLKDDLSRSNNNAHSEKELDSVDLFARSLASDLKNLKERDLHMAKHEIRNIVFKYQMAQFDRQPILTPPPIDARKTGTPNMGYYQQLMAPYNQ